MKKLTLFTLTLMCAFALNAQTTKKVLFIGNSYTGVNNLPHMVFQAAESVGDVLIHDSHTPGGARLMHHAANATAMSKMSSNIWDHVVLQAQSQEPSWGQSQMQTEVFPYAKILCDTIRHYNACSEPMFYMTWGRKNGDASNCQYAPWVCTYEGMDSALRASYTYMATANQAEISPAGPVWRYIRNHYPGIELYSSDESHPSVAGSYAAAMAFYTVIFDKDPTLITWNSSLGQKDADSIKVAAKRMVYDSLSYWNHTQSTQLSADFDFSTSMNQVDFTSLTPSFDSIYWDFGDGQNSSLSNPSHTYAATGIYTVEMTVWLCGNSSSLTRDVAVDSVTSISDIWQELNIDLFPNPATDVLNLSNNGADSELGIQIYSPTGSLILDRRYTERNIRISLSALPKGIYFISVETSKGKAIKRFIRQ